MEIGQVFNPYGLFNGSFIPNCIMRSKELTASDKLVWGRLFQYSGRDGICYPKQDTIAEEIGVSERTVKYALQNLVTKKFIRVIAPSGKDRLMHRNNQYVFLWHPVFEDEIPRGNICTPASAEVAPPTKKGHNKKVHKETINTQNSKTVLRSCGLNLSKTRKIRHTPSNTYSLFEKIKDNPHPSNEERIIHFFLVNFLQYRGTEHPPISDEQISNSLPIIEEFMSGLEDEQILDVYMQHFNKKLFHEQGLDFRFGLFVSNLHMYTSERYK